MKRLAILIIAVASVGACSSSTKPARVVTVTVPPSHPTSSAPSRVPTSGSPTGSPTPTGQTSLDGTCDSLLPDQDVVQAIGGAQPAGRDAFVVGVPEKDIGRIGYLNCRYGVTGTGAAATPKIEIGVSLYGTSAQAATRIQATTDDYTAHGATARQLKVGSLPATVLTGGTGTGYDVPLLVVASGQRTVAVSIAPAVATGAKADADATALASLALQRSAG